ncbi:hypothetical protein EKN56_11785 [Limnobaculum zhutongyuii]|uniref:RHS protein conserved region domain-containing protein n=2 Tax=Limnobaculum zhutongyuii TaxID=2498113 RepID=A0A411WRH0_9GAMM|nr:hypothetical protein EKN56_11785 [Limnobaculum zhutongyuii]TQS87518.1 hypothetical protein ELQ32_14025 [Limnobaculum zhutongyuii]
MATGANVKLDSRFFVYYLNTFEPLVLQCKQQGIGSLAPPEETGYYFYQNDPNGMPLRLYDAEGEIAWSAHYTAFGRVDQLDAIKVKQPLRFLGQYFDEESGLHYNRHRYYDPRTGIFVSQDPIGLAGGSNPYQFALNTFSWADPLGLASLFDVGTYGSQNGGEHVGDGLQSHELIRHEYLRQEGLANDTRLSGNPAIALDLDHHTRGPEKDSRGVGGVHYHEGKVREERGLGRNDFSSTIDDELDITTEAMRRAGVPESKISQLRTAAKSFYNKLKGCEKGEEQV